MIRLILALALAACPFAATAQTDPASRLTLEQRMLLRCSAAFALVGAAQERGEAAAQRWPRLAERGREFFVRASAQVMDEAGLDRAAIETVLRAEAQQLLAEGALEQVMPVCISLLPPE